MTAIDPAADRHADDPLVPRLREVLCAAVRGWRKGARFGGAIATVVPDHLIDEIAARLAPVLRDIVGEAVEAELDARDAADLATIARTASPATANTAKETRRG